MYSEALAKLPQRKEEGAGDARRSTASQEALYLGTLGPKCLLSHDGRRVAMEGYLAVWGFAVIFPAKITLESRSGSRYLH